MVDTEVIWTNCKIQMPLYTDGNTLIIRRFNGIVKSQKVCMLRLCSHWYPELYEWTEFSREKLKLLTKE